MMIIDFFSCCLTAFHTPSNNDAKIQRLKTPSITNFCDADITNFCDAKAYEHHQFW